MKRAEKYLRRRFKAERGATLGEYAIIVALLSLVVVVAAPTIGIQIGRVSCAVVSLNDYFYFEQNGSWSCVKAHPGMDLSGGSPGMGYLYW